MIVALSGASGFIGRSLSERLLDTGHSLTVLSRKQASNPPQNVRYVQWEARAPLPPESLAGADAIVHLAGEPVAQRWTPEVKERIQSSRIEGTRAIVDAMAALPHRPETLVCASAIGYYGDRGDEILTEASAPGNDFLANVCRAWEAEAERASALGVRVVKLRIGIVLAAHGGALARMLPAFRAFAGGRIGSGRQWMSWIHLDDLTALIAFALSHPIGGAVNATAPEPVTNAEFTRALAASLHRPAMFPVPALALKALFGEMAEVLLGGQRVLPQAALAAGFVCDHPKLAPALVNLRARG